MMNIKTYRQPWLQNAVFDGIFILMPAILALIVTALLPAHYRQSNEMPVVAWVALVLLIDVAHVYSTLFRTYWDKQRFASNRILFIVVPIACYIAGILLYSVSALLFWRILAYLAVFHFIRQQYGFMRLYSRYEDKRTISARIDMIAVYAATLYPLIYWHFTPGRNFNWFVEGDFIVGTSDLVKQCALYLYCLVIALYSIKEIVAFLRYRILNLPKTAIITTTFLSWYFGIVYFNGDMTFTLLNVVAHGVPYMALIWIFRPGKETWPKVWHKISGKSALVFFLGSIFVFSYFEEGIWDGFIWREHEELFSFFSNLPAIENREVLALLVPLLSLPQSIHYVLDGFIWRREKGNTYKL